MPEKNDIATCLWFERQALEAAKFYAEIFPRSSVDHVMRGYEAWPGGEAGDVMFVEFTLLGRPHQALNGGPGQAFSEAVSLSVACEDQQTLDRYWRELVADGGQEVMCGWLRDRYGLRWQVIPAVQYEMMREGSPAQAAAVHKALLTMVKPDEAALRDAYRKAA